MIDEDKSQLEKVITILDELLESDELSTDEWNKINDIYHKLEDILED